MKNFNELMKQAQVLQQRFQEAQDKVALVEAEGQSGGGMVKVTLNGKGLARSVKIDPSLADPKDVGMLEDLVLAAINDARTKVDARVSDEMAKVTGGLPLPPGMKF
ncbi:MAG: YbaB/EbfC family nucleoid-associated protein [Alphaproteobacteria bacterium]|nr:YbaB/EbfC family nucleoid-associated protein [Alphaproteobacteria bacterium]